MKQLLPFILMLSCVARVSAQSPADFMSTVRKDFDHWDSDHNGTLDAKELALAIADPQSTNENAAAIAALKRASRLNKTPLPAFTLDNIAAMTAQRSPDLEKMFADGLKRIAHASNRALFPAGLPAMETIRQGKLGNCFCLAPLGALVHRDPSQVASMYVLQTDGSYQIRLGKKTVAVTPLTDAEIALTSATEGGGIWVNLYEKAVGMARNEDRPAEKRVDSPYDAERGGSAGTMLSYITGHDIVRFSFKFAKEPATSTQDFSAKLADLRKQLADATRQNHLMTCGTIKPTTPGLTPNHAYAVLDYDATSDCVRLWNPHGQAFAPKGAPGPETGYQTTNGVFQIPIEQFVRQFSGMAFEVAEATNQN